jgi:large subunit ribosomal protein L14e
LIDGPQNVTGVHRQVISTRRVTLTPVVATGLRHNASQKSLKKAWEEQGVLGKWQATAWAKKLEARKNRAAMNDFDRFKVMIAKKQKAKIVAEQLR